MTMLNLANGVRAHNYWKIHLAQQRDYGTPVDKMAMTASAQTMRSDVETLLADLHRDGVATIENYWSAERCASARTELDRLMAEHPGCVRHFSNDSDKRVFGAENAGPVCNLFHDDVFLKTVGEIEGGFALYNLATLGARIDATDANRGSGDGWHRDAFGFQFKAILYLCDVNDENGPLEYICGSQKLWRVGLDSALGRFPVPPESRIDRNHVDQLTARGLLRPKRVKAKAGTVILANTTGVHGGAPLKSGNRYALTNYYYFPYQIGQSLVDKFEPTAPGVADRLAPFLAAEQHKASEHELAPRPDKDRIKC